MVGTTGIWLKILRKINLKIIFYQIKNSWVPKKLKNTIFFDYNNEKQLIELLKKKNWNN